MHMIEFSKEIEVNEIITDRQQHYSKTGTTLPLSEISVTQMKILGRRLGRRTRTLRRSDEVVSIRS